MIGTIRSGHTSCGIMLLIVAAGPACSFDPSASLASGASDASQGSADADPNAPDADPNAPDADPNAPDADPSIPDASSPPDAGPPPPPDAGSGTVSFQEGFGGYAGTVDTYLTPSAPATPQATLEYLKWEQDEPEYGLLRFENIFGTSAQQIPPGASIMSATLTVVISDVTNGDAELREAAVQWGEAVTFDSYGGDRNVQNDEFHPEVITSVSKGPLGSLDLDVTESLRRWASGARVNQGWIFVSKDDNDQLVRSSDYLAAPEERPLLVVEYFWP